MPWFSKLSLSLLKSFLTTAALGRKCHEVEVRLWLEGVVVDEDRRNRGLEAAGVEGVLGGEVAAVAVVVVVAVVVAVGGAATGLGFSG